MKRAFLDFMKSLRVQAPQAINPAVKDDKVAPEPEPDSNIDSAWDIKMTAEGYPILPTTLMEKEVSKAMCEKLMREYIMQHYCRFIMLMHAARTLITIRSGHWEEE